MKHFSAFLLSAVALLLMLCAASRLESGFSGSFLLSLVGAFCAWRASLLWDCIQEDQK